jgi:hypothetical protein
MALPMNVLVNGSSKRAEETDPLITHSPTGLASQAMKTEVAEVANASANPQRYAAPTIAKKKITNTKGRASTTRAQMSAA